MPDPAQAPVLVGIDGSPASELSTAIAFDEASRRGVDLIALHAWTDTEMSDYLPVVDWSVMKTIADETLAQRLAGWQERYPDVNVRRRVVSDQPARQLVDGQMGRSSSWWAATVVAGLPECWWDRSAWRWCTLPGCR